MLRYYTFPLFLVFVALSSCGVTHNITRKDKKEVRKAIELSPVFSKHFTGFVLYDPAKEEVLIQRNAHRYFTPASNTKILTFFTALHLLKDSMPYLEYAVKNDTVIFRGGGNPVFLHPDFEQPPLPSFLADTSKFLFFSMDNFRDDSYGEGWMWDDYNYAFQTEKSSLPIYENNVRTELPADGDSIFINPVYFQKAYTPLPERGDQLRIQRAEKANRFTFQLPIEHKENLVVSKPFIVSQDLICNLLSDTLHRRVAPWTQATDSLDFTSLYLPAQDTLYRRLLHQSDNFIAEQLLLMSARKLYGYQNTKAAINYAKDSIFNFLTDELLWVDGSGISRYNLLTPAALVEILDSLQRKIPLERIKDLFPAGGISGTIGDWYGGTSTPYLFAKTGTLRNNHNLSGYIITKSNRLLIFSFMNNHFKGSSGKVKQEMERVLRMVYERF